MNPRVAILVLGSCTSSPHVHRNGELQPGAGSESRDGVTVSWDKAVCTNSFFFLSRLSGSVGLNLCSQERVELLVMLKALECC